MAVSTNCLCLQSRLVRVLDRISKSASEICVRPPKMFSKYILFFAGQLWFCIFLFGYFIKSNWRSFVRHYAEFVSSKKVNILLFGGAGNSRSLIKREISKSSTTRVPAEECPHVILLSIIVCMC